MAEKKYVTEVEEGDVQIIKRVHFRISRPRTEVVQDIVLDLLADGRKELMKLMALEVCRQNLADGYESAGWAGGRNETGHQGAEKGTGR